MQFLLLEYTALRTFLDATLHWFRLRFHVFYRSPLSPLSLFMVKVGVEKFVMYSMEVKYVKE